MSPERLQKVLASAGIASRRDCETLISEGRVAVNGRVVRTLGARVDPAEDEVTIDGRPVGQISARTYVMLNKPPGVISTAEDTHDRPTVVEMVDLPARLFPVGRLDKDSEGLLLLTDDGEVTQRLTHPSYEVEKEYRALLDQPPSPDALRQWRSGVELDGQMTMPAWVEVQERTDEGTWVSIVLREGRKRQIREVAKLLGYDVLRLIRVREGPLLLGDLPTGAWRPLTGEEITALRQHVEENGMSMNDETDEQPRARGRRHGAESAGDDAAPRSRASASGARPRARDRAGQDNERPARFDDERGPRRDSGRNNDNYRDDRGGYDSRPPRREGGYDSRPPRRDDRGGYDSRPPRREGGYGERREGGYDRPRRDDYGNHTDRSERPSDDRGRPGDKPAPSRAWRARQEQEEQARKQRSAPGSRGRGRVQRGSASGRSDQRPPRARADRPEGRADRPPRPAPRPRPQESNEEETNS